MKEEKKKEEEKGKDEDGPPKKKAKADNGEGKYHNWVGSFSLYIIRTSTTF